MLAIDDGVSVVVLSNDSDFEGIREIAGLALDRTLAERQFLIVGCRASRKCEGLAGSEPLQCFEWRPES